MFTFVPIAERYLDEMIPTEYRTLPGYSAARDAAMKGH
jgi:hypothetical protein